MIEVKVDPGICGLRSTIKCDSEDMQEVTVSFETACPSLKPLEQELGVVDGYEICFARLGDGVIYELCHQYCKHPGCPVPSALIKGIEAACGLALPKDAEIKIEKN